MTPFQPSKRATSQATNVVDGPNRELRSRKHQGELKFASRDRTNGECGSLIGSKIFSKTKKEREKKGKEKEKEK